MAAGPNDRERKPGPAVRQPAGDDPPGEDSCPRELRRKAVHQSKDKAAKALYGDRGMVEEFLRKHVFGKIVPDESVAGVELARLWKAQTEHVDPKFRTVRHADVVWKAPFRDSWLYVVFLFEAQSTVDWRMPVRILLETALAYDEICKDAAVRAARKLPPVLPVVVHVGREPWTAPTRLEGMLADEAKAFLPFALGHRFVLVSEAEEARSLERADTPRTAGLKLRYAGGGDEFREALATLKQVLPRDSAARRPLLEWVRSSMIDEGAREEDMAQLNELEDLEKPVFETWWAKERREAREKGHEEGRMEGQEMGLREGQELGLREGQELGLREGQELGRREGQEQGLREGRREGRRKGRREAEARAQLHQRVTLVRQARRKFGAETAEELAGLLESVFDFERFAEIAELIIDCASGCDLLEQAAASAPTGPERPGE